MLNKIKAVLLALLMFGGLAVAVAPSASAADGPNDMCFWTAAESDAPIKVLWDDPITDYTAHVYPGWIRGQNHACQEYTNATADNWEPIWFYTPSGWCTNYRGMWKVIEPSGYDWAVASNTFTQVGAGWVDLRTKFANWYTDRKGAYIAFNARAWDC